MLSNIRKSLYVCQEKCDFVKEDFWEIHCFVFLFIGMIVCSSWIKDKNLINLTIFYNHLNLFWTHKMFLDIHWSIISIRGIINRSILLQKKEFLNWWSTIVDITKQPVLYSVFKSEQLWIWNILRTSRTDQWLCWTRLFVWDECSMSEVNIKHDCIKKSL